MTATGGGGAGQGGTALPLGHETQLCRLAVASLVLALIGIVPCLGALTALLALIFGIIALTQISKRREELRGQGLALAGVVLGGLGLVWGFFCVPIVAAIAIPKFADLIRKSNEGATRGNLGAVRSALSIYYGDMEGVYPADVSALTIGQKYIKAIPTVKVPPHHADDNAVNLTSDVTSDGAGWSYNNVTTANNYGTVWVRCTHTDTKGKMWSEY